MKSFFLPLLCLLFSVTQLHAIIITTPTIGQTQYRWRNDDGNQTTATWKAAVNAPVIATATDVLRLRIELANTGTGAGPVTQTLEYSSNGGTSWTIMNNPATNAFTYQASTFVANGANTTQQLPNTTAGTFSAGRVISNPGAAVNLTNGNKTEYEWVIRPTANAAPSTTYIFRSSDQQAAPTVSPTLTMACSGAPTAGTVNGPASVVCNTPATLNLAGNTAGPGISYQWQYTITGAWIDFGSNTDNQATPAIVQETKFRCIVKCVSGDADSTAAFLVSPQPLNVDLGEDINICVDKNSSIVLDAGNHPNSPVFLWDDESSSQVRAVNTSGTYSVEVTDMYTCRGSDTINVILRENPAVELGNDTTVCNGIVLSLNAGNEGIEYFWNTGQTGQTIDVTSTGDYNVFVTSALGCISTDTIHVRMQGELPGIQGIQVSNDGSKRFYFTAVDPQNVIGFDWDFGDGTLHSFSASPYHDYANAGDYIVKLRLSSTCGFTDDTLAAHIVGIHQINVSNEELIAYPNPAKGIVTLLNKGNLKMQRVEVYNILGQVIYHSNADANDKHTLDLSNVAAGSYTIEIYTDKGTVARKIEVTR
ncbi:T9SS type A sorting domain-containing protein [Taibaiella lutea]|uniref:T9SS type A sorting domain-containing protein n=1 Tax=Taibaiella lutea TaxID=2608001 RepID=A0A5M6CIG3_9BACT|nr:T9SS type A sorting domain-containing protein [Taibaiella lutea]KAA5534803.1 T9SS type A sorting domain-containing protein [Taibaiella lutea]